jgi:hypothetical protein
MSSEKRGQHGFFLPDSKLLDGARAPTLLGSVVADVRNPTDHYEPRNLNELRADPDLLPVQQTTASNTKQLFLSARDSATKASLSRTLYAASSSAAANARSITSANILTRFLEHHPGYFKSSWQNMGKKIEDHFKDSIEAQKMDVASLVCWSEDMSQRSDRKFEYIEEQSQCRC